MIAAISWIPKGVSKSVPEAAEPPSKEEIEMLIKSGILDGSGDGEIERDDEDMDVEYVKEADEVAQALLVANALEKSSKTIKGTNFQDIEDGLRELDMDNYDEEDDDGIELFSKGLGTTYYPSNDVDPYLKDKDGNDSEDLEDMIIKAEDSVIICACNEDDVSHLEIWILEDILEGDRNMFIHHDIMLPAFPLCMAWLDCPIKGGEKGNFIAVGSMEPAIEIWDLDIMDEVQPSQVLGGIAEKNTEKKEGTQRSIKYKKGSHTDSVLGLAWNNRNLLASASADNLVKIWDVATGECNITMEHHTDKVQAVAWEQSTADKSPNILLSGSFDHSVVMKDVRTPEHTKIKWSVNADVESLAWDPHTEHSFVVSLENGIVAGFDTRGAESDSPSPKPSFTLKAHDKAVSSISYSPSIRNLLATGSTDKMVKLWDLSNDQPSCVASKNPKAGAVFSISFSKDSPYLLAVGGSKGNLEVWDTSDAWISWKHGKQCNQNYSI